MLQNGAVRRAIRASCLGVVLALQTAAGPARAEICTSDLDCAADARCHGLEECREGSCGPVFTLPRFPLESLGWSAYTAEITSVLDHSGRFYTQCCDTRTTAYTGESVDRGGSALCPSPPEFPQCFLQICTCAYGRPSGEPFVINGNYVGLGGSLLLYDGHAGYDYAVPTGTPIVTPRAGRLCKAIADPVNGRAGAPTAWDKFHTFYVDHGEFGEHGYATWYLHARDLEGEDVDGRPLAELAAGQCADVAAGQVVAGVGNFGTFLPHLHFEVRRHPVPGSPESTSARILDPYGWQGEGPDPLADNPQAASQPAPLWQVCGNGRLECGEVCDDGNNRDGDGCMADCELDPELAQCREDLALARDEIERLLRDPPILDEDGDGEDDRTDRCPGTAAGAGVDAAGCSLEQFCAALSASGPRAVPRCLTGDWGNDAPLLRLPRDCQVDRRSQRCVPAD